MYEYFESKNNLYLIKEECYGVELFDKIIEHIDNEEMYTEKEAEIIFQVMSAIEYCHNNGVNFFLSVIRKILLHFFG